MPNIDTGEPDAPPREIELKFLLGDRDLETLARHPEITKRLRTPLVEDATFTVYYDTPERDLGRSRVTLRLWRKNGRHVQAVKADREGRRLASVRDEWEWTVSGLVPELGLLKGRRLARLVPPSLRPRLAPAYEPRS